MKVARGYVFAALKQYSLPRVNNHLYLAHNRRLNFNSSSRPLSIMSNSNSNANNDGDKSSLPTKVYDYPLIDVDCNLIHPDLISMLSPPPAYYPYDEKAKSKFFNILHHPSTSSSNIQGMFAPSSTIEEAEIFHEALLQSTAETRNNVNIRMSVGIHPYHTSVKEIGSFDSEGKNVQSRIQSLLERDNAAADDNNNKRYITCIGETGLDYSDGFPEREEQLPWFEFQLQQAKEYNMPIFIHERLAFQDTIELIDKVFLEDDPPKIIVHCFTGKTNELKEYISRGYYISVSGYILKSGDGPDEINQCLKDGIIPLDKLMIETDAPYMGFNTCRESYYNIESMINDEFNTLKSKKRKSLMKGIYPNVPAALPKVLEHVVETLNVGRKEREEEELSIEMVASTFLNTSKSFFGF